MTDKRWKNLRVLLLIGSALAAIKLIFFDYSMDEEYQIMMAYRNIRGDHLFVQMWEPHQTSAFLCVWLMRLYSAVTGTFAGVIVFLRVCTTLIQIGISYYFYRVMRCLTEERYAFLLSVIYFNVVPKIIQIPEFSNMQLWFFTLMVLFLMQYYAEAGEGKRRSAIFPVMTGVCMSLEVLSYPSCILLFPLILVFIFCKSKEKRWRDCILFSGTCALCAAGWLLLILSNVGLKDFLENVQYILNFDLTHEITGATNGKFEGIVSNIVGGAALLAIICVMAAVSLLVIKKKNKENNHTRSESVLIFAVLAVVASEFVQLVYWVFLNAGYEMPQIHLLVLWLAGAVAWKSAGVEKKRLQLGIWGSLISCASVIYISDLPPVYALPHGLIGPLFCALLLIWALQNKLGQAGEKWARLLLVSLCFLTIFGKGFTLRGGGSNTILETRGVMKHGPAAGIFSTYMGAYIYNSNYEDFNAYIQDGDKVLIVTNMVFSPGTTPYMFKDVDICHYSIVDPTAYDERLLEYWERYPEKVPNVIVVDCWYGQLQENPDNWIMQYIETEFGYQSMNDGKYVRFYRR